MPMIKKLEVINITKYFGKLHTLENVSLTLEEKQFVSILGPSGSGKSSLFNIIAGLETVDKGRVLIEGKDHTGKTGRVSYMQQKDLLLPWRNILDNVMIPLTLKGVGIKAARIQAKKHFALFGLEGFEKHYPNELSGGMRQRAALLRTYLFAEDIMLLDEPFGSLDAISKGKMHLWLLGVLKNLRASILFITHDIDEAIFLSDRIYILSERPGQIKAAFDINIPRPRAVDCNTSEEFIQIKRKILNLL